MHLYKCRKKYVPHYIYYVSCGISFIDFENFLPIIVSRQRTCLVALCWFWSWVYLFFMDWFSSSSPAVRRRRVATSPSSWAIWSFSAFNFPLRSLFSRSKLSRLKLIKTYYWYIVVTRTGISMFLGIVFLFHAAHLLALKRKTEDISTNIL